MTLCKHGIAYGNNACWDCISERGQRFWDKQPIPPPDPRDVELASARKVIEAARRVSIAVSRRGWDEGNEALQEALRDYDAITRRGE